LDFKVSEFFAKKQSLSAKRLIGRFSWYLPKIVSETTLYGNLNDRDMSALFMQLDVKLWKSEQTISISFC